MRISHATLRLWPAHTYLIMSSHSTVLTGCQGCYKQVKPPVSVRVVQQTNVLLHQVVATTFQFMGAASTVLVVYYMLFVCTAVTSNNTNDNISIIIIILVL